MVLRNYVILEEGKPARMHFVDHELQPREITDPVTGRHKTVTALVFQVDELEGKPVLAYYSITSQKHADQFAPYLERKRYLEYDFVVTQIGRGFLREYKVEVIPRRGS